MSPRLGTRHAERVRHGLLSGLNFLWQQFEFAREAGSDTEDAEVAPIRGQYPIDAAPCRASCHHPIDQPQTKVLKRGVEFESVSYIGRDRQFIFVARGRVEDIETILRIAARFSRRK